MCRDGIRKAKTTAEAEFFKGFYRYVAQNWKIKEKIKERVHLPTLRHTNRITAESQHGKI